MIKMRTKEEDIFRIFYKTEAYESRLRDLKISEERVLGYSSEYKTLYNKIISENNFGEQKWKLILTPWNNTAFLPCFILSKGCRK